MSFNRKYAGLPDLDLAPDIYETPDLTDGASTIPTTTLRTASNVDDDAGDNSDIDRQGINADEARAHFLGATVDAREANFSDSIAAKRKAYRSKSRRRRKHDFGADELDDPSDSEDESVERKLARLRREVEELKDQLATQQSSTESAETAALNKPGTDGTDGVLELSRALDNLYASSRSGPSGSHSAAAVLSQKLASTSTPDSPVSNPAQLDDRKPTNNRPQTPPSPSATGGGVLAHAASFDGRLALIEAAMGISSSSNPFVNDGISEPDLQPVLPALDHLTSRLATLMNLLVGPNPVSAFPTMGSAPPATTVTTPHLESLSSRVRKLTADTEALAIARKRAVDAAKAAQNARISSTALEPSDMSVSSSSATEVDLAATQRDEQATKIQALYATLPTIQSLHPILPSVLERLRSLRAIHAGAAHASESLDVLEKRQADMAREIEQWREGLRVVEEKMKQGEAALKNNIETVEPWVRDLESRLDRLGVSGV
ncbi:putative dynactin subunit [Aspergillus japonicus CBS 114.51]|uniref:Putative dynactin subunit n=1 Tax=Aspergillus japonicus CBS 114.51 TaxID=1448312 RepID=A0A8T8WJL8_ASPJA|nr:putative dynactin subunit [Aspergillus japonicus CBS 114.51]RAH75903.1 putative dynactin subunit [Aspergillus japonicus CBS 114.51]